MNDFARDRKLVLPPLVLENLRARYSAFASDDAQTLATIKRIHDATGQIIDPHTAVAAAAVAHLTTPGPKVILSTAHPAKFPDAVARAIGLAPPVPPPLAALDKLPEKLDILPNSLPLLRQFISSRLAAWT
jgi:threonine synthase